MRSLFSVVRVSVILSCESLNPGQTAALSKSEARL